MKPNSVIGVRALNGFPHTLCRQYGRLEGVWPAAVLSATDQPTTSYLQTVQPPTRIASANLDLGLRISPA